MQSFVAIDFETANEHRSSACSIGAVRFDSDGNVADRLTQLIHPHPDVDYFNPVNIWIHGITPDDVAAMPQWGDIADQVAEFIGDDPLVAHNMAFDGYVLSDLAALYGRPAPENRRFCTMRLARRILADKLRRKGLDNVFSFYFPGETFDHHHATADAEACGRIFAHMQADHPFAQLEELCPPTRSRSLHRPGLQSNQAEAAELIERYGHGAELAGEHIAITGTLKSGRRDAVEALVSALGGTPEKSLTKKVTMLVVGTPAGIAKEGPASRGASGKLTKATALRHAGSPIEVVSEEEFFNRLG